MGNITFSITTGKQTIKLDSKRTGEASFTVTNTSSKAARGQLKLRPVESHSLTPAEPAWLTLIGDAERNFGPQATTQITMKVAVPASVLPGKYAFRLDAVSTANPDDDLTEGPPVVMEVATAEAAPKKPFPWWIVIVAVVVVVAAIGVAIWSMRSRPAVPPTGTVTPAPPVVVPTPVTPPPIVRPPIVRPLGRLEINIDRPGLDFQSFDLPSADPILCQRACWDNGACRAFTYVRPGVQGPSARCWLKNSVPNAVPNNCCVSGLR
jgi:PAN domain